MFNKTNKFKMSESKVEQEQIKKLLAKNTPIRVIQYVISKVNTCEQKMIELGKENKNSIITKINGIVVIIFHYCYC